MTTSSSSSTQPPPPSSASVPESSSHELLFELGVEELPHGTVKRGADQLFRQLTKRLGQEGISFDAKTSRSFATPRRLAVLIKGLPHALTVPARLEKGPRLPDALSTHELSGKDIQAEVASRLGDSASGFLRALMGFARAQGLPHTSEEDVLKNIFPLTEFPGAENIQESAKPATNRFYRQTFGGNPFIVSYRAGKELSLKGRLETIIRETLESLTFDETMRWGNSFTATGVDGEQAIREKTFPRPIRYLLLLLNDEVIPLAYAGLSSDRISYGHRWTTKNIVAGKNTFTGAPISISRPSDWEALLLDHDVIADADVREQKIRAGLAELEATRDWKIAAVDNLIPIVTYLVESPTLIIGTFDESFLELPEEVIMSEMVEHQKYFPVRAAESGKLLPFFVITSNLPHLHLSNPSPVQQGNERVLSARLRDGLFFYHQDKRRTLLGMAEELQNILFIEGLGSIRDKMLRVTALMKKLRTTLALACSDKQIEILGVLAKADLASLMVGEFPALQGLMGATYARDEDVEKAIVKTIGEQYAVARDPSLIKTDLHFVYALSESLGDLISSLALGLTASGSEDPYGLRRAATLSARTLILRSTFFSLRKFWDWAETQNLFQEFLVSSLTPQDFFENVLSFLNARLTHVLKLSIKDSSLLRLAFPEEGSAFAEDDAAKKVAQGCLPAVVSSIDWNPYRSVVLLAALTRLFSSLQSKAKLEKIFLAERRIAKILAPEQQAFSTSDTAKSLLARIDRAQFAHESATVLWKEAQALHTACTLWLNETTFALSKETTSNHDIPLGENRKESDPENFEQVITKVNTLVEQLYAMTLSLDAFFENVLVNAKDPEVKQSLVFLLRYVQLNLNVLWNWQKLPLG